MTGRSNASRLGCALIALLLGATVQAQTIGYNINTGDLWLDQRVGEVNDYGGRYRQSFMDEMSSSYGAPRSLLQDLLEQRGWSPGEVFLACLIAHLLGQPCEQVVEERERHPGEGWGVLAKRLGIKPGSPEFHALKQGTVSSYSHWGQDIEVDREVRVDWSSPSPGKSGHKESGKPEHAGNKGKSDKKQKGNSP